MGVRGLARYCYAHETQTALAYEQLTDVTLAVDFVGFQFFVCHEVAQEIETQQQMPTALWLLLGGCPMRLEQWVEAWLARLRVARIHLVFVADPPQCFLGRNHSKTPELLNRAQQKADKLKELYSSLFDMKATRGRESVRCELKTAQQEQMRQYLQETQGCFPFSREKLREILKKHGIPVTTATREADEALGDLVRSAQAFAVLANDSDFLCMRGVQYIPFSRLRIDEGTGRVSAHVFFPDLVAASLQLPSHQLADLALLCTNDATQQLDAQFKLAQELGFPRSSSPDAFVTPEAAATWLRKRKLPILDNKKLPALIKRHTRLGAALLDFYQFYGLGDEVRQRIRVSSNANNGLHSKELERLRGLIDQHQLSSSLVDVLHWKARKLSAHFDLLPVIQPGKNVLEMLSPARRLLYQALRVDTVNESFYDGIARQVKELTVPTHRLALLDSFTIPSVNPSPVELEQAWRSLIFNLVYQNERGMGNATFLWKLVSRQSTSIKSLVASLLVLYKCDMSYLDASDRVLTPEQLEVLLLTSMVCLAMKPGRLAQPYDFEPVDFTLDWRVYVSARSFIEVLRAMHFVRVLLGEPVALSSCDSIFSAEIFLAVYTIISSMRDADTTPGDAVSTSGLTRSQVDSVLCFYITDMKDDERHSKWDDFCQVRAALTRLVELVPATTPEAPVKTVQPEQGESGGEEEGEEADEEEVEENEKEEGTDDDEDYYATFIPGFKVSGQKPPVAPSPDQLPPPIPAFNGRSKKKLKNKKPAEKPASNGRGATPSAPAALPTIPLSILTPSSVTKKMTASQRAKVSTPRSNGRRSPASRDSNARKPSGNTSRNNTPTETTSIQPPLPPGDAIAQPTNPLQGLLETLPVFAHREQILKNVASNQLTIIQGETGCGKSTSVPQFILDESLRKTGSERPVNIFVTQPRRIAAIELAKTVSQMRQNNEFGEDGVVGKVVGYRIGQKLCATEKTKITYVTTGYMLERLIHDQKALENITHLVIDEVHERSMDVDALLLLLKLQFEKHPHLRLIIMSATMDAKVLIKYFSISLPMKLIRKSPLFVGSKLFPVENVYLDDLMAMYPDLLLSNRNELLRIGDELARVERSGAGTNGDLGQSVLLNVHDAQLRLIPTMLQLLIAYHHQQSAQPQCILVFLPGIGSINRLYEELTAAFPLLWHGIHMNITVLHSTLELEQQQMAFQPLGGHSSKVILATNIAESSITIPDVTHVINCGIEKQIQMPNAGSTHAEVLIDVWCSRASIQQRSGRAGRLMPGVAFHLFTEDFMQKSMSEFTTPEMLRKPLDRIVLQLKGKLHQFGVPSDLLKQALDVPDLHHIDGAYKLLALHGAIDGSDEESAQITAFGSFVCHMPLSMDLCRLLLTGTTLHSQSMSPGRALTTPYMLAHVVILSAILANPDLFVMPSWYHLQSATKYMSEMKQNLKAKLELDGGIWSEPLAIWRFYMKTMGKHTLTSRPSLGSALKEYGLSFRRFQALNLLISDTCERLATLARQGALQLETTSIDMLTRLDSYASSQIIDRELMVFAESANKPGCYELEVLRFLVIHNYSDQLMGGIIPESGHYEEDENLSTYSDRVDLSVIKDHMLAFFSLSNKERKDLFTQLARKAEGAAEEFTSIAYADSQVSIYTTAGLELETPIDEVHSFDDVLERMSFPISLLYYIQDHKFPVNFGRMVESKGEKKEQTFRFRVKGSSGGSVNWTQSKDGVRVTIGGRSLFSLPVRSLDDDELDVITPRRLLAVYTDRLFTGTEARMFCSKCTLLPPDALGYHAMVLLASVRAGTNIWVQIDKKGEYLIDVRIDQQAITLPKNVVLLASMLKKVNVLRAAFSAALQGKSSTESADSSGQRLPVEVVMDLCDDENIAQEITRADARSREYELRKVMMIEPTQAELRALREENRTPPRFPELVW